MARSGWRALFAGGFATPHVLLAINDSTSTVAQIGAARLSQKHAQSLHKNCGEVGPHSPPAGCSVGGWRRRMELPYRASRWASWIRRSKMASAKVGSPAARDECQDSVASW